MNRLLLLCLCFLPLSLLAQDKGGRVVVPGTHCTLIPPPYFLPAEGFSGFSSEEAGATIEVIDVEVDRKTIAENFAPSSNNTASMKFVRTDTLTTEGEKVPIRVYLKKTGDKKQEVQIRILGNGAHSVIVSAFHGAEDSGLAPLMRKALLSARFDGSLVASPEVAAPFSVSGKQWGFTPEFFIGTTLSYEAAELWSGSRGNFKITATNKVLTPDEKEVFLQRQIQGLSDLKMDLTSVRPVTIQYMDGFELIARTTSRRVPELLHYTVLFQDDASRVYTLTGTASGRPKYWEKRFGALAASFKLK